MKESCLLHLVDDIGVFEKTFQHFPLTALAVHVKQTDLGTQTFQLSHIQKVPENWKEKKVKVKKDETLININWNFQESHVSHSNSLQWCLLSPESRCSFHDLKLFYFSFFFLLPAVVSLRTGSPQASGLRNLTSSLHTKGALTIYTCLHHPRCQNGISGVFFSILPQRLTKYLSSFPRPTLYRAALELRIN